MSIEHCELLIKEVRRRKTLPEICYSLQPLWDKYAEARLTLELLRGSFFWRARRCARTEPWPSVTDMGAPPKGVSAAGRLNDPGESLLYAALTEETALAEIDAQPGEMVQVIGYRGVLKNGLRVAVVGELVHVHKLGYMRFTGSDPGRSISRMLNEFGLSRGREIVYIDAFLRSLLAEGGAKNNDYIFTRAIARMFFQDPDIDAIVFESTKDPLGFNITVRPEVASERLITTSCFQCRVGAVRSFGFRDFALVKDALNLGADGFFRWEDPLPSPRRRFFNLTKEEAEVARRLGDDPNAFLEMKRAHRRR